MTTLDVQSTTRISTVETNLKEPLSRVQSLALKPLLIAALAIFMGTPTETLLQELIKYLCFTDLSDKSVLNAWISKGYLLISIKRMQNSV